MQTPETPQNQAPKKKPGLDKRINRPFSPSEIKHLRELGGFTPEEPKTQLRVKTELKAPTWEKTVETIKEMLVDLREEKARDQYQLQVEQGALENQGIDFTVINATLLKERLELAKQRVVELEVEIATLTRRTTALDTALRATHSIDPRVLEAIAPELDAMIQQADQRVAQLYTLRKDNPLLQADPNFAAQESQRLIALRELKEKLDNLHKPPKS